MKLVHYSSSIVELRNINYQTSNYDNFLSKPMGLWVSDDDCEDNWKNWCESTGFNNESLQCKHMVTLHDKANILCLSTDEAIQRFNYHYKKCYDKLPPLFPGQQILELNGIDWRKVKAHYNGLIITPYNWNKRLHPEYMWYYGWDCASGCIWNISVINSFYCINSN